MRIIAAVTLLLCSLLTGIELTGRERRRRDILAEARELCLYMSSCIRYEQTGPERILRSFSGGYELCGLCLEQMNSGADFHTAWKTACEILGAMLSEEEAGLLLSLGCDLGRTDVSGELMRLSHIYEQLGGLYQRQCEQLESRRKLYIPVCGLTGVLLTIIII